MVRCYNIIHCRAHYRLLRRKAHRLLLHCFTVLTSAVVAPVCWYSLSGSMKLTENMNTACLHAQIPFYWINAAPHAEKCTQSVSQKILHVLPQVCMRDIIMISQVHKTRMTTRWMLSDERVFSYLVNDFWIALPYYKNVNFVHHCINTYLHMITTNHMVYEHDRLPPIVMCNRHHFIHSHCIRWQHGTWQFAINENIPVAFFWAVFHSSLCQTRNNLKRMCNHMCRNTCIILRCEDIIRDK